MKSSCIDFVRLDFEGGLNDYRNAELGMDVTVPVVPSGIAPERRECLVEKLNQVGGYVRFVLGGEASSTIHIGKSNAFDAYGRFLGLAEGIGEGNAFVMLDDTASDEELLAVIRHETGHILGMLDHGGMGLERYAWQKVYSYWDEKPEEDFYNYFHETSVIHYTYANRTLQGVQQDETCYLECHDNGTAIYYGWVERNKNDPDTSSVYTTINRTVPNYLYAVNCTANEFSIAGGTATDCVADTISVWTMYDFDVSPELGGYNFVFHYGKAVNCTARIISVTAGALAINCTAKYLEAKAGREWDGSSYVPMRGELRNCTVASNDEWSGYLTVTKGGIADNILIRCGDAEIGYRYFDNESDYTDYEFFGLCEASNLIIEDGGAYVYKGGSLHNATINGTLYAEDGAALSGTFTCKEVNISGVAPEGNITIKLDLHDYAVANYTEWLDDDCMTQIAYFADYTTKTYHYAYNPGHYKYVAFVEDGTFDNKDGRFDMSDWKYSFNVDLGSVDELSMSQIVVDFGGTEKDFAAGSFYIEYPLDPPEDLDSYRDEEGKLPLSRFPHPFQFLGDVGKYIVVEKIGNELYHQFYYDASRSGEIADVLWLANGEEGTYTVALDPIMNSAREEQGFSSPWEAQLHNGTLTVKGSNVESGTVSVTAKDEQTRKLTCEVELMVVPESLPLIGKKGTAVYANLLKKAQKEHLTTITAALPCDPELALCGMKFKMSDLAASLTVNWTQPSITLKLQGKLEWTYGKGSKTLTIDLSGDNYFSVTHSNKLTNWDIVGKFTVPDFKIGKFGFSGVYLKVNKGNNSAGAGGEVTLPGVGISLKGDFSIVDGYLDSVGLGVGNLNTPLGATGLMLQSIYGSISGIATSVDLTFGGSLGLSYGPVLDIEWDLDWLGLEDGEYSLCTMEVGATISTSGEITGTATVNCLGGFISGSGEIKGSSGSSVSVTGSFSMLKEAITIKGVMTSNVGAVTVSGQGRMQVPKTDYFGWLGGMGLTVTVFADLGEDNTPLDKRYILAWEEMTIFGNKFAVGIKCNFKGNVELLGNSDLLGGDKFGSKGPGLAAHSVASPDGNGDMPTASEACTISDYGVTLFQFNFTGSNPLASLSHGGVEYTLDEIYNGLYENMQVVDEFSNGSCVTIAVNNAELGEWTLNVYGDDGATFGAYTLTGVAPSPVMDSVVLGDDARSATINYSLADLSALENAVVSIFMDEADSGDYSGMLIGQFAADAATGSYEYALSDEKDGGDYAFYVMVSSDNYAPVFSELSDALSFRYLDNEAPDQIQHVDAEWRATGTVLTWNEPYDNVGVVGYKVAYRASEEDEWSEADVSTTTFVFNGVANGIYTYRVAAYDAEGNMTAWSEEGSILVNSTANATYANEEAAGLDAYESATNVTFTGVAGDKSLIIGSTIGNAEIGGRMEDSIVNGKATLLANGSAVGTTVNGNFTVQGTAEGITVADGGQLLIGETGIARNVTVEAGGSLYLKAGAEYEGISVAYGASLTIPGTELFRLGGDIYTATSIGNYSGIYGNGYKIHIEQYKQASELELEDRVLYDRTALVGNLDKFTGDVLDIIIDTASYGEFKIADEADNFSGGLQFTDYATGQSLSLGLDEETPFGTAVCTLHKELDGGLWLTVWNPNGWDYEDITVGKGGDYEGTLRLEGLRARNITVVSEGWLRADNGAVIEGLLLDGGGFYGASVTINNANVSDVVLNKGEFTLNEGANVSGLVVNGGTVDLGDCVIEGGAFVGAGGTMKISQASKMPRLEGTFVIQGSFSLPYNHPGVETDAHFVLDLAGRNANSSKAFISEGGVFTGNTTYALQAAARPEAGYYTITHVDSEAPVSMDELSFSFLTAGGTNLGKLRIDGDSISNNGFEYMLYSRGTNVYLNVTASAVAPDNIIQTQTWTGDSDAYVVEYSADGFQTALRVSVGSNAVDAFALPSGSYQWRVRPQEGGDWTAAQSLSSENAGAEEPIFIQSNADGVDDVFFARATGTWSEGYTARHTGLLGGWNGTREAVALEGRNKLADIIEGSNDANVLVMTDDANGDALFVDDIYSALPGDVALQQSRLAKIDEIRAGAGDDVVDLTSQRFAYVGEGVTVRGGLGNDVIWANGGSNRLFGDAGNDRLVGASGDDVLAGGAGNDTLHGGGGDDVFTFGGNWGQDSVEQLASGTVTLWFQEGNIGNWNEEALTYSDGNNSVTVAGVTRGAITLRFGNEAARYGELLAAGAFSEATSERIFEDSMLA